MQYNSSFLPKIIEFTKDFVYKRYKKDIILSDEGIYKYLFVYQYLSIYDTIEIKLWWEKSFLFKSIVPKVISKNKYYFINKFIYISKYFPIKTPLVNINNKTEKIDKSIHYFNSQWKKLCHYTKYLTIDESMASYKGRICIKQFIKDKPKNFGIKFFAIFSNDKGYIYELVPYSGKRISYEKYLGLGGSVVKNLIQNIKNKNHVLCFENFYSNLSLFN